MQAALSVEQDMKDTAARLFYMAASLKLCDDADLRALGHRTIHFKQHGYFILYKVVDDCVKPIFHSDRGYQYTSKTFRQKIVDAGMTQSMSRVGRCIDNGPMEGFWGIMKREMYYGRKYKTKEVLIKAIEDYIDYYTNKRVQCNLGVVTPMDFYEKKLQEAA